MELIEYEDGSEPAEMRLVRIHALAIWRAARQAARQEVEDILEKRLQKWMPHADTGKAACAMSVAALGRTLHPLLWGAVEESQVHTWALHEAAQLIGPVQWKDGEEQPTIEGEGIRTGGIVRASVSYGQLKRAVSDRGLVGLAERLEIWRGEEGAWLRQLRAEHEERYGQGLWSMHTRRGVERGVGAHQRAGVETYAVSPTREVHEVAQPRQWPWRGRHHAVVQRGGAEKGDEFIEVTTRLATRADGGLEARVSARRHCSSVRRKRREAPEPEIGIQIQPRGDRDIGIRALFHVAEWPPAASRHSRTRQALKEAAEAVRSTGSAMTKERRAKVWHRVRGILGGIVPKRDAAERRWEREAERAAQEAQASPQPNGSRTEGAATPPEEGDAKVAEARKVLGVGEADDVRVVRRAYMAAALRAHPDKGGDDASFVRCKAAWQTLQQALTSRATTAAGESTEGRPAAEDRSAGKSTSKGPKGGAKERLTPRVDEAVAAEIVTASRALGNAIDEWRKVHRGRKERAAKEAGSTLAEQRAAAAAARRRDAATARETARTAAIAAMRAEERRGLAERARRERVRAEEMELVARDNVGRALREDASYVAAWYELWLPRYMWASQYQEWATMGGHEPVDIRCVTEVRSHNGTKLEVSVGSERFEEFTLVEDVVDGRRAWTRSGRHRVTEQGRGERAFLAPRRWAEASDDSSSGEEEHELEAKEARRAMRRAKAIASESARLVEEAQERRAAAKEADHEGDQAWAAEGERRLRGAMPHAAIRHLAPHMPHHFLLHTVLMSAGASQVGSGRKMRVRRVLGDAKMGRVATAEFEQDTGAGRAEVGPAEQNEAGLSTWRRAQAEAMARAYAAAALEAQQRGARAEGAARTQRRETADASVVQRMRAQRQEEKTKPSATTPSAARWARAGHRRMERESPSASAEARRGRLWILEKMATSMLETRDEQDGLAEGPWNAEERAAVQHLRGSLRHTIGAREDEAVAATERRDELPAQEGAAGARSHEDKETHSDAAGADRDSQGDGGSDDGSVAGRSDEGNAAASGEEVDHWRRAPGEVDEGDTRVTEDSEREEQFDHPLGDRGSNQQPAADKGGEIGASGAGAEEERPQNYEWTAGAGGTPDPPLTGGIQEEENRPGTAGNEADNAARRAARPMGEPRRRNRVTFRPFVVVHRYGVTREAGKSPWKRYRYAHGHMDRLETRTATSSTTHTSAKARAALPTQPLTGRERAWARRQARQAGIWARRMEAEWQAARRQARQAEVWARRMEAEWQAEGGAGRRQREPSPPPQPPLGTGTTPPPTRQPTTIPPTPPPAGAPSATPTPPPLHDDAFRMPS